MDSLVQGLGAPRPRGGMLVRDVYYKRRCLVCKWVQEEWSGSASTVEASKKKSKQFCKKGAPYRMK